MFYPKYFNLYSRIECELRLRHVSKAKAGRSVLLHKFHKQDHAKQCNCPVSAGCHPGYYATASGNAPLQRVPRPGAVALRVTECGAGPQSVQLGLRARGAQGAWPQRGGRRAPDERRGRYLAVATAVAVAAGCAVSSRGPTRARSWRPPRRAVLVPGAVLSQRPVPLHRLPPNTPRLPPHSP